MGKSTKSTLDKLQNDVKVLQKFEMMKLIGGKTKSTKWNTDKGIGGIVPQ